MILFREIDIYKQAFFAAMDATLVLFNGTELGDYEKTNLINRVLFFVDVIAVGIQIVPAVSTIG